MTGYATAQSGGPSANSSEGSQPALELEIRSVNSRFLDLAFKLQDDLRGTEPALRDMLGARLKRGKVEVRAWIKDRSDDALRAPSAVDLQKIVGLQDSIQAWCPKAAPLSVAEVLQLTPRQHSLPGGLHGLDGQLAQMMRAPYLTRLRTRVLVEHLNQQVATQQQSIDLLVHEVLRLREQGAEQQPVFRSLRDELPPHY